MRDTFMWFTRPRCSKESGKWKRKAGKVLEESGRKGRKGDAGRGACRAYTRIGLCFVAEENQARDISGRYGC